MNKTEFTSDILEQPQIKKQLQRVKLQSTQNKLIVDNFYLRVHSQLSIKVGRREVFKSLLKQPQKVVLVIVWNLVQPQYLLDQVIAAAVHFEKPIYFTQSSHFIAGLLNKKFAASCGVITSINNYSDFKQYIVCN